jgi:hypothetical protein
MKMRKPEALLVAVLAAGASIVPGTRAMLGAQTSQMRGSVLPNDSLDANYVRPGFGTLRQDDITVHVTLTGGLQVRAIPLEESLIRLLSPDSYSVMRQLKASKRVAVDSVANRARLQKVSLWYVTFYGVEQGEARFSPQEFIIRNIGRDFRPVDVLPLTSGFSDYRLKQREVQSALYVFDGQLDVYQPLTAQMESTESTTDWTAVLRRTEQERALVRSRAGVAPKTPEIW